MAVANGRDPWAKKTKSAPVVTVAADTTPTFKEAACKVHALNAPTWRNGKHNTSWINSLDNHVFPIFGDTPIDEVGQPGTCAGYPATHLAHKSGNGTPAEGKDTQGI